MRRRFLNNIKHSEYFTIEALEDGLTAKLSFNVCDYRIDDGSWNTLPAGSNTPSINKGQTLSFRGNLTPNSSSGIGTFTISKSCNIEGNIMSLLYGDDFEEQNDLTGKKYAFYKLFYNCEKITDASNLILPATTLANSCYNYMFYGCISLTQVPELPATTVAPYCYSNMFGCSGLTTAPELPATTLASNCYYCMFRDCTALIEAPQLPATTLAYCCYEQMFYNCTSLTTAPELPATTLVSSCYHIMFRNCRKLNYIKMLATDISALNCLKEWVDDVASTGIFVKHPDMTSLPSGENGIPSGWTVEDYVETNLITFTIDGYEYQAEEGMTWEDWVNSEYNTDGYYWDSWYVRSPKYQEYIVYDNINNNHCRLTDVIIPNRIYILRSANGSGGSDD